MRTPIEGAAILTALLRDLAGKCHNGAADPWQEFYDLGYSPMLDRMADRLEEYAEAAEYDRRRGYDLR